MSLIKEGPFAHFDCGEDCDPMTDDLTARLDRAITEARASMLVAVQVFGKCEVDDAPRLAAQMDRWIDKYAALVAVRARLAELEHRPCGSSSKMGCKRWNNPCSKHRRENELTAEAERLLGEDA